MRLPPFRSLDIYRLVVARGLKHLAVAKSFHVDPSRISQVIRRVRDWVNDSLGDWLFPGRDDLRFYVALELAHIRAAESPDDPHEVTLTGPGCTYTRHTQDQPHQPEASARDSSNSGQPHQPEASATDTSNPGQPHQPDAQARPISAPLSPSDSTAHQDPPLTQNTKAHPNVSPQPINSARDPNVDPFAATADTAIDSIPSHIRQMGLHIAQLLMLWKKHHNLTAALKPIGSSPQKSV
jgi:hypothetical protein